MHSLRCWRLKSRWSPAMFPSQDLVLMGKPNTKPQPGHPYPIWQQLYPIGSMYGIYANIWDILMVKYGKCYHIYHTWILWVHKSLAQKVIYFEFAICHVTLISLIHLTRATRAPGLVPKSGPRRLDITKTRAPFRRPLQRTLRPVLFLASIT